jgi:hypothetical protein
MVVPFCAKGVAMKMTIDPSETPPRQLRLAELMKAARGVIDSGVPDLASNPRHLAGFGSDGRHR